MKIFFFTCVFIVTILCFLGLCLYFYFLWGPKIMVNASIKGDIPKIRFLKTIGIKPNMNAFLLGSPLTCAAAAGKIESIKELLMSGADINYIDGYGVAAIHCAVKYKREESVLLLINNHCNINILSRGGQTALDVAIETDGNDMIIALLKKNNAKLAKDL